MGLTYYSNLLDVPIYSNERSSPSSSSEVYLEHYPSNTYANLCSSVYENVQLPSANSSPIYLNLNTLNEKVSSVDLETNVLVQSKQQTMEKFEVNIVSCTNGKNESNRMKIPRIPSSSRRRRTLNRPRRYRCRSSTPFRTLMQSNATRRQHQTKSAMISPPSHKSVSNQLYQTISDRRESMEQVQELYFDDESIEEEPPPLTPHRKSSSSTLVSLTNTIISSETLSSDAPPRSSQIALGLDQKDVQFIHEILQGDHRASNRITALKQAYVRAAHHRQEQSKSNSLVHGNTNDKKKIQRKPSVIASKIRDELEKYDELPVHLDSFSDDETYSTNDNYRYYHRRLPEIPSTTHRIIDFISTLKRQLQYNFQKFRSRILLEIMSNPPRKRPHHTHRPRSSSYHSTEHSYPFHRQRYSRSHSNISQMSEKYSSNRPRTFRVTAHQHHSRGRRMHH